MSQRLLRQDTHERDGVEALGVVGVVPRCSLFGLRNRKCITSSRIVVGEWCQVCERRQVKGHVDL